MEAEIRLIQTAADAADLLAAAEPPPLAVALDVEWGAPPPAGGPTPAALAQLAVAHSGATVVYVVDFVLLAEDGDDAVADAAAAVGALLRLKRVPLFGFGVATDLAALSSRHVSLGAATHAVDVRRLLGFVGLAGASLARAAAALLGRTLDKSLQRSDWSNTRPLTAAQIEYAALDAAILLDVGLELARRAPPARWPLSGAKPKAATDNTDNDDAHTADPATLFAAAARWWGVHAQAGLPSSRRRRARGAPPRRQGSPSPPPRPAAWDGVRAARFVTDQACEGLARQLRLLGVAAHSAARAAEPGGRAAVVAAMRRAVTDDADGAAVVAVTTDAAAAAMLPRGRVLRVKPAGGAVDQAAAVLAAFELRPDPDAFLTRCVDCGEHLNDQPLTRAGVDALQLPPGRDPPPPGVDAEFWVCSSSDCMKIFWQGGQHRRALETLRRRWVEL